MGLSAQELHAQGLFVNRALDSVGMCECIFSAVLSGPDAASDSRVHRLGSEIELLWHHVKRRRLYIFFAFRYSTVALVVATTALNFFDLPSLVTCRTINYIDSACVAAIQVAVSVAGIAVSAWAVANQDGDFDVRKAKNGSGMSCLVLYVPDSSVHWMSAVWIILMVFDLIVFVLTAFKTMEAVREPKMALSRVLLRDACLYFGYAKARLPLFSVPKLIPFRFMVLLNAANVVTYYVATPYLRGCLGTLANRNVRVVNEEKGQKLTPQNGHADLRLGSSRTLQSCTFLPTVIVTRRLPAGAERRACDCRADGMVVMSPAAAPSLFSTSSLDPRLRERRTPPEMATGLEAQMKLAALAVQSVLFGIYIALVLAMIYLLTLRPHSETVRRTSRLGERLLFAGLILLSAMITGQWICIVIRAFQASIVLIAQITYGTDHVSNYFFNDCIPPAAALAAVLVHVRAVLGRGSGQEADAEMAPVEGRRRSRGSSWVDRGSGWGGRDGRASTWDGRAEACGGRNSAWAGQVERSPSTPTFGDRASGEERRSASTEGRRSSSTEGLRSTVKRCSPIRIHVEQVSQSCVDLRDVPKAVCR
ncbi:hypothetical protein FB107DRAFT_252204 [Schizophyllum commune]